MRDEIIVASTVAGIADPAAVGDLVGYSFSIGSMHFWNNQIPHISAVGFSGAETVNLWKLTAGTWGKVYDGEGNEIQLTATNPHEALYSPGVYGVTKSAEAGITVTVQMP